MGNRAEKLYVTMRERAKAFAATGQYVTFEKAFAIAKFSFCGAGLKRILAWEQGISKKQF